MHVYECMYMVSAVVVKLPFLWEHICVKQKLVTLQIGSNRIRTLLSIRISIRPSFGKTGHI